MRRAHSFGHNRERAVKKLLEAEGWFVIRAPGSLGVCDLVAIRADEPHLLPPGYGPARISQRLRRDANCPAIRMIEVKATTRSAWAGFPPADRQALLDAAHQAGATAELAHWPAHGELKWYSASEWPAQPKETP